MPQDHPDGTVPMQLTGADKKVPTDWQDQFRGVYLQPEWTAKEGTDKNLFANIANQAFAAVLDLSYTVPIGKILYVNSISFAINGNLAADAEKNNIGRLYLYDVTNDKSIAVVGGNGGGQLPLLKPIAFSATTEIKLRLYNMAGHNTDLFSCLEGYEI